MPFKSKSQMRYMFSQHPEIAQEFADSTKDIMSLPEKAGNKNIVKKAPDKNTKQTPYQRKKD